MKTEKLSKLIVTSFNPTPIQIEKIKVEKKIDKNISSKEKNLLKIKIGYSSKNNKKIISIKRINKLDKDKSSINNSKNKIKKNFGIIESKQEIKQQDINKQKHSRALLVNRHFHQKNNKSNYIIKTPTMFIPARKSSQIKVDISKEKDYINIKDKIIVNSYINNNETYIKQNNNKKELNKKKSYNNIINQFIENKINVKDKINKLSFDLKTRKINLNSGKIFFINNNNNSDNLLIIKNKKKNIIRINTNEKKIFNKTSKNRLFSSDENKTLRNKKNIIIRKKLDKFNNTNTNSNTNINNISSYISYFDKNKKTLIKTKTEEKSLIHLQKKNISKNQKKLSSSNISFSREKNTSFLKLNEEKKKNIIRIDTEPKYKCFTIIEEEKKLNENNCFTFLHHYLLNTVSTKNKIVLKRKDQNRLSYFSSKNDKQTSKSKSIKRNKKYSFINRNSFLKNENSSKTKEVNPLKNKEASLKKVPSIGINRNLCHIKSFSSLSNLNSFSNNIKIFNGKIEDYLITKELGKGSYAIVKLAVNKNDKKKYAIKIYSRESLLDPQKRNTIKNEINILKQLDNINIMKIYEEIYTPKYLYLVMEYINGISLLETMKQDKNHYFKEKRAIKIFIQITKGIIYCQSKNICHRDIKLENILLINNKIIKIIDFGFAVKATKETYQKLFCGTPSYMAPEIVNKEKYIAHYSDLWSMGVLFFAMLYGRFPFRAKSQEKLFEKINEANVVFPDDIVVSDKLKNLLRKIFVITPVKRISLNELLNELIQLDKENIQ